LSRDFLKKSLNIKSHENPSSGNLVFPCRQTDMTKLIVAFPNFANEPNTRTNTNRSVGIEGRHYESCSERLVEFDAGALHLLAVKADDSLGYTICL